MPGLKNKKAFITKAELIHKDKYNYDNIHYIGDFEKINILCNRCKKEFYQSPINHLASVKCCPNCDRPLKYSLEEFIRVADIRHDNKYNYSNAKIIDATTETEIICPKHGKFLQSPRGHLLGKGCNKCYGPKSVNQEEFLNRAQIAHGGRFGYSLVEYKNAWTKVKIICKEHGIFLQSPSHHLAGQSCPKCSSYRIKNTKEFIEESIKIYGDIYNYDKTIYKNSYTKVKLICAEHGEFSLLPLRHLRLKQKCPKCSKSRAKSNTKDFIVKAIIVQGNKYDYSKVKYRTAIRRVKIICRIHGEFLQTPHIHLRGAGCPKCGGTKKSNTEEFIKKARIVQGDKYDYSKSKYVSNHKKVIIICPRHGEFEQEPANHLYGYGCPFCTYNVSKSSQRWLDSFNNPNIEREIPVRVGNHIFTPDGYDRIKKIIYEFNGDFWHGNPKKYNSDDTNPVSRKTFGYLYRRTIEKQNIYKEHGFTVISIWESDWLNMENSNDINGENTR
jgi:hypothetical protein